LEGTKKIPEGSICVNQIDEIGQTERQIDRKRHCKVTKFGDLTMVCVTKHGELQFMKFSTGKRETWFVKIFHP
jgi:hypothetical protein